MTQRMTLATPVSMFGIFLLALLTAAPGTATTARVTTCAAWQDDFRGVGRDPKRWLVADGRAPGYRDGTQGYGPHIGYYEPDNVRVRGGYLVLRLTQELGTVDGNTAGVISHGALISTAKKCGYGTYTWRMRMSSTATSPSRAGSSTSGSVSAGFVYVNNSQTEIVNEFSGATPIAVHFVNFWNRDPSRDPSETEEQTKTSVVLVDTAMAFHTYKFVWKPGRISYFIDGQLEAVHVTNVPSAPAHFMISHWGTNSPDWGGLATVGVTRHFFVDRVSYKPARKTDRRDNEDDSDDRDDDSD